MIYSPTFGTHIYSSNADTLLGQVIDLNQQADEVVVTIGRRSVVFSNSQIAFNAEAGRYEVDFSADDLPEEPPEALKQTPEGAKHDEGKLDFALLPPEAIEDTVRVLMFGAEKYGRDNWRSVPDGYHRYLSAAMRHISAIQKGEVVDPESGLPHAAHAVCCLLFLNYFDTMD